MLQLPSFSSGAAHATSEIKDWHHLSPWNVHFCPESNKAVLHLAYIEQRTRVSALPTWIAAWAALSLRTSSTSSSSRSSSVSSSKSWEMTVSTGKDPLAYSRRMRCLSARISCSWSTWQRVIISGGVGQQSTSLTVVLWVSFCRQKVIGTVWTMNMSE